ncbi:zinc finger protein 28-like [Chelonus insularis]|uniref:zinc finger protein 28-like n=1 Tax=Chelonus insularis TaxID=460826 RepID=UPI00158D0AA9|nr:zinc finger protein 28-like [Chelonus insularis]
MGITDNMTDSWLSCPNLIITTDTDIEEEIEDTRIFNTHQEIYQLNNVPLPATTTETLFSDNIPTRVNERAHISIIDMNRQRSDEYQAFFVYEDLFSRYVILKPLKEVSDIEVIEKLIDIFFLIGAPKILQSHHGRGYTANLVRKLRRVIPTLNTVHGNILRWSEHRKDFKTLVELWEQKNSPMLWYEGLNFIQTSINTSEISESESETSHTTPAKIFFESNLEDDLVQLVRDGDSFDEIWTEEDWMNEITKNNFSKNCHKDLSDGVKMTISHDTEKTDKVNVAYSSTVEEKRLDDIEVDKSPILTSSSFNESLDSNDTKENIDTSNLPRVQNKALIEIQKTGIIAKKSAVSSKNIFKCSKCNRIFRRINHLMNHMRSHKPKLKDKNEYKDDVVLPVNSETDQLTSNSERILNNHIETQITDEREVTSSAEDEINCNGKPTSLLTKSIKIRSKPTLECTFCDKKFTFRSVLERHLRIHTNEKPYFCKICNKNFKQFGHLSQHAMGHIDFRSFQCTICDHKFESYQVLKDHIISHKNDNSQIMKIQKPYRLYECDICKKVFSAKSVLERHIFTHIHDRPYSCKICNKKYKQAGHLRSHMLVHTGEKKFECTICFKRFSVSHALKIHLLIHTGYKPYQCKICEMRFRAKRNLDSHLLTHTNDKPHVCTICGRRYTLADTLKRHITIAHVIGKTYQCEICAKMFSQSGHLDAHKKVHNDERPFQCLICDKSFKHNSVLKSHLLCHSNFKPFECDYCKATFSRKNNLKNHILSVHMNERPYFCCICGKKFKTSSHLTTHIMIHSNHSIYQCQYCDKTFYGLDYLKLHMRRHKKNFE